MKNGLSRSEQRTVSKTQKQPLDRKSPIQVSLSPETAFVGRESRLSPRVCAAGLAAWSAETRGHREQLANRQQYLCRAIFQYRDAVDVVGDNRRPWSSKRARVIS